MYITESRSLEAAPSRSLTRKFTIIKWGLRVVEKLYRGRCALITNFK